MEKEREERERKEAEIAAKKANTRMSISADEMVRYRNIHEALIDCFGEKNWPIRTGYINVGHGYMAWFPHLSTFYDGKYRSTESRGVCINYLSGDWSTITEERTNGQSFSKDDESNNPPAFTFVDDGQGGYLYIGVYKTIREQDDPYKKVSDRIETTTDLSRWKLN